MTVDLRLDLNEYEPTASESRRQRLWPYVLARTVTSRQYGQSLEDGVHRDLTHLSHLTSKSRKTYSI